MSRSLAHAQRAFWQCVGTRRLHTQPAPTGAAGKRHRWTKEQDEHLAQLVAEKGRAWTEIAAALGIEGSALKARSRWSVLQPKRRGAWSKEEDECLVRAIREYTRSGNDLGAYGSWVAVAKVLTTNRTPAQCRMRWTSTLLPHQGKMVAYTRLGQVRGWGWSKTETTRLQSVVGAIVAVSDAPEAVAAAAREEPWLLLDDSASENLARQFWVYIASRVQTRTAHQCQQKWQSIAQASSSGRCTTDEAPRLAQLVEEHGRRWTFLASEYFPGRRPRELYHLHTRWCNIEKRYGVDLSKIDPFSRICDYKGSSALRPTGGNGDYDPSGPLVRVSKTGLVSALAPYILAVTKVGPPQKRRRRSLASKLSGASSWAAVPSEIADRLFAALSRYKNDWVSISRSVGIPARECRKYADILGERLPSVRASIRDAELEQLARDHKTQPHGSDAT